MNSQSISPPNEPEFPTRQRIGAKAFYLEPWLVLASIILWLAVLPFAGLAWSAAALATRIHAHVDGAGRSQATRSTSAGRLFPRES